MGTGILDWCPVRSINMANMGLLPTGPDAAADELRRSSGSGNCVALAILLRVDYGKIVNAGYPVVVMTAAQTRMQTASIGDFVAG